MNLLELLASQHQDWCKIVASFGCPAHLVEDIVQEMYLKMDKYVGTPERIMYDEKQVNSFFVYVTLRNMYLDYAKARAKVRYEVYDSDTMEQAIVQDPLDYELSFAELHDKIWDEVDKWHWYDAKLFRLYMTSQMSMRDISTETQISLSSIFTTLKNGKTKLAETLAKDYAKHRQIKKEG